MLKTETPHLTTALTGPLQLLEKKILSKQEEIESWFQQQWQISAAPIYGSVDLRNAGFKLAPVDMNLFPAGFNNIRLNPAFVPLAVTAAQQSIHKLAPDAKNILLIPESHTRNLFYWENIHALLEILQAAGFNVEVGSLSSEMPTEIILENKNQIKINFVQREKDFIKTDNFVPDIILLNNDLSEGIPEILQGLRQLITPPAELGWSQRLKSQHFQYYAQVSEEFANLIQIDPWLIAPLFHHCGNINFMQRDGEDCLAKKVESLLETLKQKYDEYKIPHAPYIVIKADAGTYGMAVMMVRTPEEVYSLNRKQRTHMSKVKGGRPVQSVIIQEGVYSFETWGDNNAVAEPVVYLIGQRVIGGFYRVHKERGVDENLNSPGMQFEPLVFAKTCHLPSPDIQEECQNRFYAYGVVARLSMLAAAREMVT